MRAKSITKREVTQLAYDIMGHAINNTVIVEVKAVDKMKPVFEAQLLTYMRLLEKPQGLLLNFFSTNLSRSSKPMVNEFFSELPD